MRLEKDPIAVFFAEFAEAEDLESAAVGKNGFVPVHEFVQSSGLLHQFHAWAQIEMIRVSEDDFGTELLEFMVAHGLDAGLGANRHENRRLHITMSRMKNTTAGKAARIVFEDGKMHWTGDRVQG